MDYLLAHPKEWERYTHTLTLLGDIVYNANKAKSGLGAQIIPMMFEGLGDDGFVATLLQGAGLDLRLNLAGSGISGAMIP